MSPKTKTFSFFENLFLLGIAIALLPPFKFPFIEIEWINTIMVARLILFLVFIYCLYLAAVKDKDSKAFKNIQLWAVLIFFIFQSLSVVNAINLPEFLKAYEKVVFGFAVFITSIVFTARHEGRIIKKTILLLFSLGVLRLFLELILYFQQDLFLGIADALVKSDVVTTIKANTFRNRTYIDLIQEASLPFFLYYFYKGKATRVLGMLGPIFAFVLGVIAFISNWRGRVISFVVLLLASLLLFKKTTLKNIKILVVGGFLLFAGFYLVDRIQIELNGYSVVDRLLNKDDIEDKATVEWRFKVFGESFELGKAFPLGVGLKNFYDWSHEKPKAKFLAKEYDTLTEEAATSGPHNIFFQYFGETGILGFSAFIFMLVVFLLKDLETLKSEGSLWLEKITFMIGFWGLIVITLFYPATSFSFYVTLFLFRGFLV